MSFLCGVTVPGLQIDLAALDVLADAAQKDADVVASLAVVHGLAEHLDAGGNGGLLLADADDLDRLVDLQGALDTAGGDGAATGDGVTSSMAIRNGLSLSRGSVGM